MALFCEKEKTNDVWFLDSGCSSHLSGTRSLFKELDESKKSEVTLGDSKKIQVEGKDTASIKTSQDDYSRMSWVYFLEYKHVVFDRFKKFKALVERKSGSLLKTLRITRGGEFVSADVNAFCEENGICRELIASYTLEQNGVAERKNLIVVEMARNMMQANNLPICYWAEAVAIVVYLLNLSPTRAIHNQTPFEAWIGRKPMGCDI